MVKGTDGKPKLAGDFGARPHVPEVQDSFVSVDPGDVHVGVAEWVLRDSVWHCSWAGEMTPDEFLSWLADGLRGTPRWSRLVVEEWKLFPDAAPFYVGSDMPTSRLIGAIAALAEFMPDGGWLWTAEDLKVYYQSPQIKVPMRSVLKRRKLRSIAKVLGVPADHASDAELHGYKHLYDRGESFENSTQQATRLQDQRLTPSQALW